MNRFSRNRKTRRSSRKNRASTRRRRGGGFGNTLKRTFVGTSGQYNTPFTFKGLFGSKNSVVTKNEANARNNAFTRQVHAQALANTQRNKLSPNRLAAYNTYKSM